MHALKQYALLLFVGSALLVSGCKEDVDPNEDMNNRLEGDWEVRSFVASGNGSLEFMGNVFQRVDLEFDKTGPTIGDYEFTYVDVNGNTSIDRGDYEIQNSGEELTLESDGASEDEEYLITIDGNDLELDGFFDYDGSSYRVVIEARKD